MMKIRGRLRRAETIAWAAALVIGAGTATAVVAITGQDSHRAPRPYVRDGSAGAAVTCVQQALNAADHAALAVDGQDGPHTTTAVKNFQRENNLTADGVVGPATGKLIRAIDRDLGHGSTCDAIVP